MKHTRQVRWAVDGLDYLWRNMRQGLRVILRRRLHNRNAPDFWYPVDEQFLLRTGRPCRIDDNVFRVARRLAEEIEDGNPVVGVRLAEGIAVDINISDIRHAGESRHLCWVSQSVVSKVNPLQRQQSLNASQ